VSALRDLIEPRLRSLWDDPDGAGSALSFAAAPAEAAYRLAISLRGAAYDSRMLPARTAPLPVVSVGNLSVGGTGKTPVSAWVVARLLAAGAHPALLLRGYGGDEAKLHRRWNPAAPVFPDPDRYRAACAARAAGADVAVLDDGFQHRQLARDLDIVLLAAEQRFPGPLLPRGPYREGPDALSRADLLVVTRRVATDTRVEEHVRSLQRLAPRKPIAVVRLAPGRWATLSGAPAEAPSGPTLAVTGVADPRSFHAMVSAAAGASADLLAFPDHHAFDFDDARRIAGAAGGRPVVVTEKDAIKLVGLDALTGVDLRVLPLVVRVESGGEALEEALRGIARMASARQTAGRT
jgi:tetraacyldisaccharide 4'-kinase